MPTINDYYKLTLAGHWLPALINGDETGLSDQESSDLAAFMQPYNALDNLIIEIVDDESSFAVDEVSDLHADCYTVRFHFTNHALTPQQQALDLN
jgi:hypothetical protein